MRALSLFKKDRSDHKYLFILSPPYSGSTLLMRIIETSKQVSSLPTEGQFLRGLDKYMRVKAWQTSTIMPWEKIKPVWMKYWDLSKPVLLEKSPPHLMRAEIVQNEFQPTSFIGMVRDPYAFCEGVARRTYAMNLLSTNLGADFWVKTAKAQLQNKERLERFLFFRYEDLVEDVNGIAAQMGEFMPEINDVRVDGKFLAQTSSGYKKREISNLNPEKIARLKQGHLDVINSVLSKETALLDAFGYQLIEKAAGKKE